MPNTKFVLIKDICKGCIKAREAEESGNSESTASTTLESDLEASTQEGDCIVVGAVGG